MGAVTSPLSHRAKLMVLAILTLGFMARAVTFQSPLFDFHSWRQSDTAIVARNFLEERFNPLYPQVDFRGDQVHGYVETGLELHAFLVATMASAVGFSPQLGRALSILSFPASALLLFAFVRDRYGQTPGMVAIAIYAMGLPLTMYVDRAFMNEPLLALLTFACLRSAQLYLRDGRAHHLLILIAASSLIAAVKPTYLIVGAPILGLFVERFGARALIRWELWVIAAASFGTAAAWFVHAHRLFETTGLTFGISNKLYDGDLLFSARYVSKIGTRIVKDVLGPVGVAGAAYGLVVAWRTRRWAEPLGIAAFLAYLAVVTQGNFHHNYYQLPVVPIGTVLAALGVTEAIQRIGDRRAWPDARREVVLAAVVWLAVVSTFARSASFHSWYEVDQSRVGMCDALLRVLAPGQRVAFAHYASPDILFCIDRKGWALGGNEMNAPRLSALLEKDVVIVSEIQFNETATLLATLGAPIVATPRFVAYGRRH
jgi:Dolichyl-phosphate-mannose-protein mannosyltransferase